MRGPTGRLDTDRRLVGPLIASRSPPLRAMLSRATVKKLVLMGGIDIGCNNYIARRGCTRGVFSNGVYNARRGPLLALYTIV